MVNKLLIKILGIGLVSFQILFSQSAEDAIRITDNINGFGSRALGMGGAYTGVADDYSAIYWNPAGLAQMRKMEFWMGLKHHKLDNDISYQDTPSTATSSATKFNSLGLVFPIPTYRGSLVFAVGYQRIGDFEYANFFKGISSEGTDRLSFELDDSGTIYDFWGRDVEKQEIISEEGNLNQWSFAGAIDVSPNVSLGIGMNFWTGSSDYQLKFKQSDIFDNFPESDFPANFLEYNESRTILSKYSSFSLKLSTLIRAGQYGRIGMMMELPHSINVEEEYRMPSVLDFDDGYFEDFGEEDGVFEYDVSLPFRFTGGISIATGPLLLSGSAQYTDWTQVKFDLPDNITLNSDYADLLDENQIIKQEYKETLKWGVGSEVGVPLFDSQIRIGYTHDPSPRKDALSENHRKYFSLGYGVLIDRILKFDLAYLHGNWKQTTFDNLAPSGTKEDIKIRKIFFTLAYRF
jgi:long-subunit fatty acid transport protein